MYLHEISQMPLLTAEQEDVISKVKRTAHALQQAHQRDPTVEEIADAQMSAHGSEPINPRSGGRHERTDATLLGNQAGA